MGKGFNGGMPGGNMSHLLSQAKAMQAEMVKLQEELEAREVTATSGGGAIEVVVNGKKEIKSLTINPDVVDKDDIETLQDLTIAAVNEAIRQMKDLEEKKYGHLTGKMRLPF